MTVIKRVGVLTVMALATIASLARAQAPAAKNAPPPISKEVAAKVLDQVLATVNGEPITRGEVINFLRNYPIPAGDETQIYKDVIDSLANTHLINQFLDRQKIPAPEAKVNDAIASLEKELKQNSSDLASELVRTNMSMADVRKMYADRIRWVEYLNQKATDAELKRFADSHKDLFSGTQVKASHILLKVDPKATPEEKEKIRQKLAGIKQDIDRNKFSFAEAANKFTEDPTNVEGAGGDIGYFALNSGIIEEFANAAFAMKKGSISDPVETPYGWHIIQVTDRKEGKELDFEQNKPLVKQMYAADLQKSLLTAERKAAKIDVKPMPTDLFPPAPTQAPAAAPATTKAAPK